MSVCGELSELLARLRVCPLPVRRVRDLSEMRALCRLTKRRRPLVEFDNATKSYRLTRWATREGAQS